MPIADDEESDHEVGMIWVYAAYTAELASLALRALDRVVATNSELAELWAETDSSEWRALIAERRASLVS